MQIVPDPDKVLVRATQIVCTADSVILDGNVRWFGLARQIVDRVAGARVIDMGR